MPGTHIDEDILDRYAMGTLPVQSVPKVEEHVLSCSFCQSRLVETDEFLAHFRVAASQVDAHPVPFWTRFQHAHRLLWGGSAVAAAACMLFLVTAEPQHTKSRPAAVLMQSLRGPEARVQIAAGRPRNLVFDIPVLPGHADYEIEIVDVEGNVVVKGNGVMKDDQLTFQVARLAPAGYWVRVYERQPARQLVAEYGLEAK